MNCSSMICRCLILLFLFFNPHVKAQVTVPQKDSILLVTEFKLFFVSHKSERLYGKAFCAFNRDFFLDKRVPHKSWEFRKCGALYGKFEKYCTTNSVRYNHKEFKRFKKTTVWANVLGFTSAAVMVPISFEALNTAFAKGTLNDPLWLFKGKLAPVLYPVMIVGIASANHIQAANKRKFKKRIFLEEVE